MRATTAGALLRQARQARGLHVAALAAAIKVAPRKLELLESDQFDQLSDATFTRALAQTMCRTLKVDPAPVLALLPPANVHGLDQVSDGLNMPFRGDQGGAEPLPWLGIPGPALWLVGLLLVAAAAVILLPAGWNPIPGARDESTPSDSTVVTTSVTAPSVVGAPAVVPGATAASSVAADAAPQTAAVPAAPALQPQTAASDVAVAPPAALAPTAAGGVLQFRITARSWIEVVDASGRPLISRVLDPGDNVDFDANPPLKVKIGNVRGTQVVFRGKPVELASFTQGNVARFELK
ncbi:MAG: helix-turn-helix domain-containing protein [Burkholderiaceae bacterium]